MKYFKWFFLVFVDILSTLLNYPLSFLVVPFASREGWLPTSLSWFQTPDNSLDGDNGWKTEHVQWLPNGSYLKRVLWLWRNPMYGFAVNVLGAKLTKDDTLTFKGDPFIQPSPVGKTGWVYVEITNASGTTYWNYNLVYRWGNSNKCARLNFGWKLKYYAEDTTRLTNIQPEDTVAQFVFSPRPYIAYQQ